MAVADDVLKGNHVKVVISEDITTPLWEEVPCENPKFSLNAEPIDITNTKNAKDNFIKKIAGMKDVDIGFGSFFNPSDPVITKMIQAQVSVTSTYFLFRMYLDGNDPDRYFKSKIQVANFGMTIDVKGVVKLDVSFIFSGDFEYVTP